MNVIAILILVIGIAIAFVMLVLLIILFVHWQRKSDARESDRIAYERGRR